MLTCRNLQFKQLLKKPKPIAVAARKVTQTESLPLLIPDT